MGLWAILTALVLEALCLTADCQLQNTTAIQNPIFLPPPVTYGNLSCENFTTSGRCYPTLRGHVVVINYTRGNQVQASAFIDYFLAGVLRSAPARCLERVLPLLCFYAFPTCDPAYSIPVYQPICKWDCEIVRDFYCKAIWADFVLFLESGVIQLGVLDQPQCDTIRFSNAGTAPMCISTQDGGYIPQMQITESCYHGLGRGYEGNISITESGLTCQAWSEQYPHQHLLTTQLYPELNGSQNYCRNPGAKGERPWCFTTNETKRWEYCAIPKCKDGPYCERYHFNGSVCYSVGEIGIDYIFFNSSVAAIDQYESSLVNLFNVARNFKTSGCKDIFTQWLCMNSFPQCDTSSSTPRPLQMCRNQCESMYSLCKSDIDDLQRFPLKIAPVQIPNCALLPDPNGGDSPECFVYSQEQAYYYYSTHSIQTCYNASNKGIYYNGFVNITASGRSCQIWDDPSPHMNPISSVLRPYLQGNNYCRNPDGRGSRPWCYTTDPSVRWEYCDIPLCLTPTTTTTSIKSPGNLLLLVEIIVPSVVGGSVIFILIPCVCIAVLSCYTCRLSRKKRELLHLSLVPGTAQLPAVEMLQVKTTPGNTENPLYCKNIGARDISLDGTALPEVDRDKVRYEGDLGQGHFGLVVKANAIGIVPGRDQCIVAVKILKEGASAQTKKEFFHEAALMHTFNHPNIVKLLGVCIEQEPLCMIFEFMELGDLNNFLRHNSHRWQESSAKYGPPKYNITTATQVGMAIDIAAGLAYLAENHYVHRDLASRNCLVGSDVRIKISDFGLSQDIYSTDYCRLSQTELLPIRWMPPEAILFARFTTQSDVWSLGVVLWEVFSYGIQPYYSMSNEQVVVHVREGNVMSRPEDCPGEIYDLMVDCWNMDPTQRPTAADIHGALKRWTPPAAPPPNHNGPPSNTSDYQNMAVVQEMAWKSAPGGCAVVGEDVAINSQGRDVSQTHTHL